MDIVKVKWGIIGCGKIAHKFVSDLKLVEDAKLYAVASRNLEKGIKFAQKHNAINAYGSYNELFLDKNIDIVYIATPHSSHAELSIKAMEHGKHVLCEKPLALNYKEATTMIETSRRTNRFFMEALWTRFNPNFVNAKKHIDNGEIGQVKYINADFSFNSSFPLEDRTSNINLGGGAILDIGIYPIFLSYMLLGVPKEILAKSIFHEITKSDIQTSMIFNYNDAQAVLYCSFVSKSEMIAKISGTKGQVYLHNSWHVAQGFSLVKNGHKQIFDLPTTGIGYTYEIIECHKCIQSNRIESKLWSHQNSLDLISILDSVRNKVGLKYPQEKT